MAATSPFRIIDLQHLFAPSAAMHDWPASGDASGEWCDPRALYIAAPVPIQWQEQVLPEIKRDEALGVIERIAYGELVYWCHRMVVTRKHNDTPHITVDLSPRNKLCKRETFPTESLFHLAKRVPKGTWKSVMPGTAIIAPPTSI